MTQYQLGKPGSRYWLYRKAPPPPIRGNSKAYTIARLRRDGRGDLADAVQRGEMTAASARRAAKGVEDTLRVSAISPRRALQALFQHFGGDAVESAFKALTETADDLPPELG